MSAWEKEFDGIVNRKEGKMEGFNGMFIRHAMVMITIVIGVVVGLIIGITDSWEKGVIVGAVIVGAAAILGAINMAYGVTRMNRAADKEWDKMSRDNARFDKYFP